MLQVRDLSKTYQSNKGETRAIARVSFEVADMEFLSVVGPSGCGKTTLLKCMSGLLEPTGGSTTLRGERVVGPLPEMAIVFQDYARSLFPWMTVKANVVLPIRKRLAARERDAVAERVLAAVGLPGFADHYPLQLSGGMQQRVAIARALAFQPKMLLLDEPFASVDAQTRAELEDLVLSLRRDFKISALLVTHDIDEAVYMADRVVVLTQRPSTVQDTLAVDLPWPRDQISTKTLPEFAALRARVYGEILDAHADVGRATEPV